MNALLIEGWWTLPHSYAHVLAHHVEALQRLYPDITLYRKEAPALDIWHNAPNAPLMPWIQDALDRVPVYTSDVHIDACARIAYPHALHPHARDRKIPLFVFGTFEFGHVLLESFTPKCADHDLFRYLFKVYPNLHLWTPSAWSAQALVDVPHAVIPHGIDPRVFHPLAIEKSECARGLFNHRPYAIHFLLVGAMTLNKGIANALRMLMVWVCVHRRPFVLVLKCTDTLYRASGNVHALLAEFEAKREFSAACIEKFKRDHLIILTDFLGPEVLNRLYNACDYYIAPLVGEGFNCCPLEALSAGIPIIVPEQGSSAEYARIVSAQFGNFVLWCSSEHLTEVDGGKHWVLINVSKSIEEVGKRIPPHRDAYAQEFGIETRNAVHALVAREWSWDVHVRAWMEWMRACI